ncbi:hypothetical protein BHE74_00057147 [Ensete ventricosum]|nr:hypothetical protein BHE74_00057147 [Ensete ventricosum]
MTTAAIGEERRKCAYWWLLAAADAVDTIEQQNSDARSSGKMSGGWLGPRLRLKKRAATVAEEERRELSFGSTVARSRDVLRAEEEQQICISSGRWPPRRLWVRRCHERGKERSGEERYQQRRARLAMSVAGEQGSASTKGERKRQMLG